jgi:hypothetical protein
METYSCGLQFWEVGSYVVCSESKNLFRAKGFERMVKKNLYYPMFVPTLNYFYT